MRATFLNGPIGSQKAANSANTLNHEREVAELAAGPIRCTEEAYTGWIRRFIVFHGKWHPKEMGEQEVDAFLSHLAVNGKVSASTQIQALCALMFLYREVLDQKTD